jgi:hypothetical protein
LIEKYSLVGNKEVVSNLRVLLMSYIKKLIENRDVYNNGGSFITPYYNEKCSYFMWHIIDNTRAMHDSEGYRNTNLTVKERLKYLRNVFVFINKKSNFHMVFMIKCYEKLWKIFN